MESKSREDLLKGYQDAKQKVENIRSNWFVEQVKIKKFDHHSS